MANERIQPDFKGFAALQSELVKSSPDRNLQAKEGGEDDATKGKEKLSISLYQDPRDQLDHERHAMRAKARH